MIEHRNEEIKQLGTTGPQKSNEEIELIVQPNKPFSYLIDSQKSFTYDLKSVSSEFSNYSNQYRLIYHIIVPDDSSNSSDELKTTIESIMINLPSLKQIGLEYQSILINISLTDVTKEANLPNLFNDLHGIDKRPNEAFLCKFMQTSGSNPIDTFFNFKMDSTPIEGLKAFYTRIISDINTSQVFAVVTEAGMSFPDQTIKHMIASASINDKTQRLAVVPAIETTRTTIFSRIQQYENVHYNLYDLHYYSMACTVPINSKLNVIRVTKQVEEQMKLFYNEMPIDANISYHDYKLGIFFKERNYDIIYLPSITAYEAKKDLYFARLMEDYSMKNQGNLIIFFDLCKSFINCKSCNGNIAMSKIALLFQLMGLITDFVFQSLFFEVMYAIFFEAFDIQDYRAAAFFTIFYSILIVLVGIYSLISPKPNNPNQINFLPLFIVFDVYYLYILICSVVAMDHINKNDKWHYDYKFNVAALVVLIVFNVIFGLIPMILNAQKIGENILDLFIYFFLGCPNYTSLFAVHSLFNASDASGNKANPFKKAMLMLGFMLSNAFFGLLIFVMVDRKTRVDCVLALAIIFTIYNFIKMASVFVGKVFYSNAYEKELGKPMDGTMMQVAIGKERNDREKQMQTIDRNENDNHMRNNHSGVIERPTQQNYDSNENLEKNEENEYDGNEKKFELKLGDDDDDFYGENNNELDPANDIDINQGNENEKTQEINKNHIIIEAFNESAPSYR